jgi:site-specific DNA recombinase
LQCFDYCRVSTEEQATDNHYSLDNQEQRAADLAKSKGWRVVRVEKDVASGKDTNRRGYQELIGAIDKGQIDCVVVYRLDRLSRNVRDVYDFLDLIKERDIAFVSITEGFDTTTAMGRAMLGVAAVFAQLTREMIAENVKDGLMRRAQAGLYNGNQCGPYGYQYGKANNNLVVVPEDAERVREIFTLFADRKWGANKIASYLNESGVPSREGRQWSTATIRVILRQPAYIGKIRWHDQVFDGKHDPIISQELWDAAQALINERRRVPSRAHSSDHLLSGIAECGACGKKLTGHHGPKKSDGSRHVSYSHYHDVQREACKSFHKSAPKLEAAVIGEVRKAAESGTLEKMAADEIRKELAKTTAPLKDRRQSLILELAEMQSTFNSWADRLDKKTITEDQFASQNKRLVDRESRLKNELTEIDLRLAENEIVDVSLEVAQQALKQFPQVWDTLEIQERRELLRNLIGRLAVYADKAVIKLVFMPETEVAI